MPTDIYGIQWEDLGLQRKRNELGSAAVEMVIVAPIFIVFLGVVMLLGRLILVKAYVDDAARASAETAVMSPSAEQATYLGHNAALAALKQENLRCEQLSVLVNTQYFYPGGYVATTVRCGISLVKLSYGLPIPGLASIQAKISDPIEEYRTIQ